MATKQTLWHSLTIEEVFSELKTDHLGLTEKEAQKRLAHFGPNQLPAGQPLAKTVIFLSQFKNPLIYILLIAAIITFFLKEYSDFLVILTTVAVNALIGFFHENKANQAIARLKKMIEYKAKVIRDGQRREIAVAQLAPGDIMIIEAGDKIPADGRLITAVNLEAVEATLTGESSPSTKNHKKLAEGTVVADRENMVYLGTIADRGRGLAVVTATGLDTQLGQVAVLINETPEGKTPLQKRLAKFSRWLGLLVLAVCFLIILEGLWQGRDFYEMLVLAIAIAASAIPEGLLIAVTVILALGMQLILKKQALVRKLVAAETLGSITVICSDKTGTLTEGRMQVAHLLSGLEKMSDGQSQELADKYQGHWQALEISALCNNASIRNPKDDLAKWEVIGSPTEKALLLAATEAGLDQTELIKKHRRLAEVPFDPETKFMATLHRWDSGHNIICLKGMPEKVLAISGRVKDQDREISLTLEKINQLKGHYERMTANGLRVLAVGFKIVSQSVKDLAKSDFVGPNNELVFKDLVFVGLFGLKDPLRAEAKETIALCQSAGIKPIIITGDHKLTARAIAREAGIKVEAGGILEGREIDKLSQSEFYRIAKKINIYARVEPRHKLRIIDTLQKHGEVVAMTGDGINDAPALKSADIGIALGSGTDVAKETADMILLDNNFKTIVSAIRQGRAMFDNLRKVMVYLMSDSFTGVILIGGSLLLGLPLPILAVQILWVNLVADGLPSFALAFEKEEPGIMAEPPRSPKEPIMDKQMKILVFLIGIFTDLALLTVFWWLWQTTQDIAYIRTFIFMAFGVASLFYIFSCRSLNKPFWQQNFFGNKFLVVSVIIGLAFLLSAVYLPFFQLLLRTVPLSLADWLGIALIGLFNITAIELAKRFLVPERLKKLKAN
ncbi:MAG: HAD-IC family P-type ATPase [bacterium]